MNTRHATPPVTRPLAWHGFQARIPADWEVTAFTNSASRGRLVLANREGPQAEVSWRVCKAAPDVARIHAEIHRRWRAIHAPTPQARSPGTRASDLEHVQAGAWLVSRGARGEPEHASSVLSGDVLVHWMVFQASSLRALCDATSANDGGLRHFAAWGLDLNVPARLELDDVEPLPGDVRLRFVDGNRRTFTVRRWGLAAHLLREFTPATFLRQVLTRLDHTEIVTHDGEFRGQPAVHATFTGAGVAGYERFLGRRWTGHALLWHETADNRLMLCDDFRRPGEHPLSFDALVAP